MASPSAPPVRPVLSIRMFGSLELRVDDRPLPQFPTSRSRSLFSFLVMNRRRSCAREVLAGTFSGDHPDAEARKRLRMDLWRVKSTLAHGRGDPSEYIVIESDSVRFNAASRYWLDVEEFESRTVALVGRAAEPLDAQSAQELEAAVALYRGDFLDGEYDEWCLFENERLKALYLGALERLMEHAMEREAWVGALAHGTLLLHHDPLREHIYRTLMLVHYRLGDRPEALRLYRQCERMLDRELGVGPMRETVALAERMRAEDGIEAGLVGCRADAAPRGWSPVLPEPASRAPEPIAALGSAAAEPDRFADLRGVAHALDMARARLERGIETLARRPEVEG